VQIDNQTKHDTAELRRLLGLVLKRARSQSWGREILSADVRVCVRRSRALVPDVHLRRWERFERSFVSRGRVRSYVRMGRTRDHAGRWVPRGIRLWITLPPEHFDAARLVWVSYYGLGASRGVFFDAHVWRRDLPTWAGGDGLACPGCGYHYPSDLDAPSDVFVPGLRLRGRDYAMCMTEWCSRQGREVPWPKGAEGNANR